MEIQSQALQGIWCHTQVHTHSQAIISLNYECLPMPLQAQTRSKSHLLSNSQGSFCRCPLPSSIAKSRYIFRTYSVNLCLIKVRRNLIQKLIDWIFLPLGSILFGLIPFFFRVIFLVFEFLFCTFDCLSCLFTNIIRYCSPKLFFERWSISILELDVIIWFSWCYKMYTIPYPYSSWVIFNLNY